MSLKGKIAIVTGGSKGIGRVISLRLAREGASVVVAARDIAEVNKVVAKVNALGGRAIASKTDVTKGDEVNQMIKTALDTFGHIDILVNSAGGSPHQTRSLFHQSNETVWDTVLDTNLKGVMICSRAVVNPMMQRRSGKIINISSIAGIVGSAGLADYSAAKGGVIAFSKALAKELASYGISINSVCPGPISSEYFMTLSAEAKERYIKTIPMGRFGKPEEVAAVVNFLASEEADYITGQEFVIDGGRSLG